MQDFSDVQGGDRQGDAQQTPTVPWVSNETKALATVAGKVKYGLVRADKKISRGRIHDARTALKRWNAVWSALAEDGWQFDQKIIDDLNKLFKRLGDARDYDQFLKGAEEFGIGKELVDEWKKSRKKARQRLESRLKKIDVQRVCESLDKLVKNEPSVVALHMAHSATADESSNEHVNFILQEQEKRVYKAALAPASPDDYHGVRKEVKRWGYLLEELAGKENKQLAAIEQRLGDLHDLDKLEPLLHGDERNLTALGNLQVKREQLLAQLQDLEHQLPFGQRSSPAEAA